MSSIILVSANLTRCHTEVKIETYIRTILLNQNKKPNNEQPYLLERTVMTLLCDFIPHVSFVRIQNEQYHSLKRLKHLRKQCHQRKAQRKNKK